MERKSAVVVVGHPTIENSYMQKVLIRSGAHRAGPSRREGMLPTEISDALRRAAGAPPVDSVVEESEITDLRFGSLLHDLGTDLVLGNTNLDFWGWVDPQSIYLLEYWRELLPNALFVLVYESPGQFLAKVAQGAAVTDDIERAVETVERAMAGWKSYNEVLLRFCLRNPEYSILVHAESTDVAPDRLSQVLAQALGRAVAPVPTESLPDLPDEPDDYVLSERPKNSHRQVLVRSNLEFSSTLELVRNELIARILERYPEVDQLYADLQSTANCPAEKLHRGDPVRAFCSLVGIRSRLSGVNELHIENESMLRQLHLVQDRVEELRMEKQEAQREKQTIELALLESKRLVSSLTSKREALRFDKDRRIQQLKSRVASLQVELEKHRNMPADLTKSPTRVLCSTVGKRILKRMLPQGAINYANRRLRGRRADSPE